MKRSHDDMAVDGGEEFSDNSVVMTASTTGAVARSENSNKRPRIDTCDNSGVGIRSDVPDIDGIIVSRYPIVNGIIILTKASRSFRQANPPPIPSSDSIIHKSMLDTATGTIIIVYLVKNNRIIMKYEPVFLYLGGVTGNLICKCDIRLPVILAAEKAYYDQIYMHLLPQQRISDRIAMPITMEQPGKRSVVKSSNREGHRTTTALVAIVKTEDAIPSSIPPPAPANPFYVKR